MFTSLDLLVLVFIGMTGFSLLAILLMFLIRHDLVKKIFFYFLTIQGMLLSWFNALSTPSDYLGEIVLGWGLGIMSVAALLLQICGKSEKKFKIAQVLVTASVIFGLGNLFLF